MPAEIFADGIQINLMWFYYRLDHYPVWVLSIHYLASILYTSTCSKIALGIWETMHYALQEDEALPFKPDLEGEDNEDWQLICFYLGRRGFLEIWPTTLC